MFKKFKFSRIILCLIFIVNGVFIIAFSSCKKAVENIELKTVGLPISIPEEVGISSDRLTRIRKTMQGYLDHQEISGAVMLISRRGKTAYLEAIGMMDIEAQKSMRTDSIFRIASMTKPITAVAVMMLYEEGHFLLSDPISKFIPEFKNPKVAIPPPPDDKSGARFITVPAKREITIKDLLTHTSGITSTDQEWLTSDIFRQKLEPFLRPETCQPHPDLTLKDEIKILAELPLSFQPGSQWGYNWSTDVLGYLVEAISGMSIDQFFHERIFVPLRMIDTCFFLPEEKASRFVAVYSPTEEGLKLADAPSTSSWVRGPKRYFIPRGGLVSTAADYVRFCQMLLNKGELDGVRLLSRKSVELMTLNHIPEFYPIYRGAGGGYGYGLHLAVTTDLAKYGALGSSGAYFWQGAFCTQFWVDPKEELITIFMTQLTSCPFRILDHFRTLAYQAICD
jgi:CubicO group peptidase (beta-lactamase class C family)